MSRAENALRHLLLDLSLEEASRHKLLALGLSRGWIPSSWLESARKRLLINSKREAVSQFVLSRLQTQTRGFQIGLLKGAALWEFLYRPGEREASDLDLFVEARHFEPLIKNLAAIGFTSAVRESFRASNFKTVCSSGDYPDFTIEVHTKLWWHEPPNHQWEWKPSQRNASFRILTLEDQFIHLAGHWIAQHTMISLHWFFDLILFLDQFEKSIDWEKLDQRAKLLKLSHSVSIARALHRSLVKEGLPCSRLANVDWEFLKSPKANSLKYFLTKHRVQDRWLDALTYDLRWLLERRKESL